MAKKRAAGWVDAFTGAMWNQCRAVGIFMWFYPDEKGVIRSSRYAL